MFYNYITLLQVKFSPVIKLQYSSDIQLKWSTFSESHIEDIGFLQNISIKYIGFQVSIQNEISNYIQTLYSIDSILPSFLLTLLHTKNTKKKLPRTLTNISTITFFLFTINIMSSKLCEFLNVISYTYRACKCVIIAFS